MRGIKWINVSSKPAVKTIYSLSTTVNNYYRVIWKLSISPNHSESELLSGVMKIEHLTVTSV